MFGCHDSSSTEVHTDGRLASTPRFRARVPPSPSTRRLAALETTAAVPSPTTWNPVSVSRGPLSRQGETTFGVPGWAQAPQHQRWLSLHSMSLGHAVGFPSLSHFSFFPEFSGITGVFVPFLASIVCLALYRVSREGYTMCLTPFFPGSWKGGGGTTAYRYLYIGDHISACILVNA